MPSEGSAVDRSHYRIFSEARLASLILPNRLVRSATWDPCILGRRQMTQEVLDLYKRLSSGGVGMIITGGLPVTPKGLFEDLPRKAVSYDDFRVDGFGELAEVTRAAGTGCTIVAQLENGSLSKGPSAVASPFRRSAAKPLSAEEIQTIIEYFVEGIYRMREEGFDGVQLHAAHGAFLSQFLSPYTNRRDDAYGGSAENRSRAVREIVSRARERVGDFPILIKMNGTDYVDGGTDIDTFPELAKEVERAGIDAIEVSGGMWDCLVRSEDELGFRPVPAPESHTRIKKPKKQSYFLKYAETLNLDIPVILVGGNRDIERLEAIVSQGKVDFISLCRPLISEPELPNRWREGRGGPATDCISCNSCLYEMLAHPGKAEPGLVQCVLKNEANKVKEAQRWLSSWVRENLGA
jgi:2,4-dienoyl-CoA reductase-like NADH-dependent reductase (Old Yellow Enzyme family)